MQPSQVGDYRRPSDPRIAPDGVRVAFTVVQADLGKDRYDRQIYLWDGAQIEPIAATTGGDMARWSPDGSTLAFRRRSSDGAPQLAIMTEVGGEVRVISDFALGVVDLVWAPDGSSIAVVATGWTDEYAELEDKERNRRPRRLTGIPFRADDQGWRHDRRDRVWLIDPQGLAEPRCITSGEGNHGGLAWASDSSRVAVLADPYGGLGRLLGGSVHEIDVESGEETEVVPVGWWQHVSYGPDDVLYLVGDPDRWSYPTVGKLYRLESDGLELATADLDRNLIVSSPPTSPAGPQWLEDGTARCLIEDHGCVTVGSIALDGSIGECLAGRRVITGATFRPDGSAAAFVSSTSKNPGELWWFEKGQERQLSELNSDFAATMIDPVHFEFRNDGVDLEGWIFHRAGDDSQPLLLSIHGGPASQYDWGFFDEFQVYAAAGYGVVAMNPRGSTGYGREFVRSVVGQWHTESPPDKRDLLAGIDAALKVSSRLDPSRIGVMGGSYGGMMTARLLSGDGRFGAGVVDRGLYAFNSFLGSSDIGPAFVRMYLGERGPESAAAMWDASPLKGAVDITAPTLIIHSDGDLRCPVQQAEQLFTALLRSGVTTEFLRFPADESHELSRSGTPVHRVERFDAILDWYRRYL